MTEIKKTMIFVAAGEVYKHNTLFNVLKFPVSSGNQMQQLLTGAGWSLKIFLREEYATKEEIEIALREAIQDATEDEWLLFYFVGHGYWLPSGGLTGRNEFLLTYTDYWKESRFPRLQDYVTGQIYSSLILDFLEGKPERHFISVLDCCYAAGMIDGVPDEANHTLFAASPDKSKAYADVNGSFFLQAFSALFPSSQSFAELDAPLDQTMRALAPKGITINKPVVRLSKKFTNHYF